MTSVFVVCHGERGEGQSPESVHPDVDSAISYATERWPLDTRREEDEHEGEPYTAECSMGCDLTRVFRMEIDGVVLTREEASLALELLKASGHTGMKSVRALKRKLTDGLK